MSWSIIVGDGLSLRFDRAAISMYNNLGEQMRSSPFGTYHLLLWKPLVAFGGTRAGALLFDEKKATNRKAECMEPKDMIGLASGKPEFVRAWADVCIKAQKSLDEWIALLRSQGVKAAHPDDGWIDRENNRLHFAYPQFNDGVSVGSLVALGRPGKYRLVKLTDFIPGFLNRWGYEPIRITNAYYE